MRGAAAAGGGLVLAALALFLPVTASLSFAAPAAPAAPSSPAAGTCPDRTTFDLADPPVLAHYYIWFTQASWNRAKIDYPAAGRYSSDEISVMKHQVAEAKSAGIDGFIVGWKSTDTLNARLAQLRDVAASSGFKLAITYQAQDFHRRPLPAAQVRQDLQKLADTYGDDPVFQLFGPRPVVALSGTWHYSEEELRSITAPVASRLRVLATEKSVEGYQRVASTVEGDLYYWSSGDPLKTPRYISKLVDMANAVRARCGLWIAPVAPGFDARAVGGHSVVDRRDGATLRNSWGAALASAPDAIGVISWNEFSENTHIEPSEQYGTRYLDAVAALTHAPPPPPKELDSSAADVVDGGGAARPILAAAVVLGFVLLVTVRRIRRREPGHP
jgi:hypothetical protein